MAVTLTRLGIEAAIGGLTQGTRTELIDDRERGLRIRIGDRGAKWSLQARTRTGQLIRVPLGAWPGIGIADARKRARDARAMIDAGGNPNEEKREATRKALQEANDRRTVREILREYQTAKLDHLRRGRDVRSALIGKKGLLRPILDRDLKSITKAELAESLKNHARTAPISANRSLAYVKAFFNWCVHEDILNTNPASTIRKPSKESSRDRYHTISELVEIWNAALSLGYPFSQAYRLLIALPNRRTELSAVTTDEVDLGPEAVWMLPADRTKNAKGLRIPLSTLAISILQEALEHPLRPATWVDEDGCEHSNPFVFSMTGNTPISGYGRAKRRLDRAIAQARKEAAELRKAETTAMPHWINHDLRTTFTTVACQILKVPANVADKCLNHVATATRSKILRIYNQDDLFDERRDALDRWAKFLEEKVIS